VLDIRRCAIADRELASVLDRESHQKRACVVQSAHECSTFTHAHSHYNASDTANTPGARGVSMAAACARVTNPSSTPSHLRVIVSLHTARTPNTLHTTRTHVPHDAQVSLVCQLVLDWTQPRPEALQLRLRCDAVSETHTADTAHATHTRTHLRDVLSAAEKLRVYELACGLSGDSDEHVQKTKHSVRTFDKARCGVAAICRVAARTK
jgi:hypothetical protein